MASAPDAVPALDRLVRRHHRRRRRTVAAGSAVAVTLAITALGLAAAGRSASSSLVTSGSTGITGSTAEGGPSRAPTFGPVPPEAVPPDGGGIDLDLVPDYVSVGAPDSDELIGYIRKEDLFPTDGLPQGFPSSPEEAAAGGGVFVEVQDVYDTDERVIGHWVSGAGFVDLDADLDAVVAQVEAGALRSTTSPPSGPGTGS